MTRRNAERIMRLTVQVVEPDGYQVGYAAFDGTIEIVRAYGYSPKEALYRLVEVNCKRNANAAMVRDGWRCRECGSFKNLTADHIVMRSHGRDDRVDNLITRCAGCHNLRHQKSRAFAETEGIHADSTSATSA